NLNRAFAELTSPSGVSSGVFPISTDPLHTRAFNAASAQNGNVAFLLSGSLNSKKTLVVRILKENGQEVRAPFTALGDGVDNFSWGWISPMEDGFIIAAQRTVGSATTIVITTLDANGNILIPMLQVSADSPGPQ